MMPSLIDKDEALKRLTWDSFAYQAINMMESVDAEPVKHGHWNEAKDGTLWCSVCISTGPYDEDSWGYVLNAPHYDYCPNCGAKMDEVEE